MEKKEGRNQLVKKVYKNKKIVKLKIFGNCKSVIKMDIIKKGKMRDREASILTNPTKVLNKSGGGGIFKVYKNFSSGCDNSNYVAEL